MIGPVDSSNLMPALERLTQRSARGIVARSRLASPGLNRWLLRTLAQAPGRSGALLSRPIIESAKEWQPAQETMVDLAGGLLSSTLVDALAAAGDQAIPHDRHPHEHQLAAWQASLGQGKSVLVTAGTGAGKTESFLIPILEDILANPRTGGGVRAILLYPLNALIESQRERLSAWAQGLDGKVRFALLNKDTPETEREARQKSDRFELRSREAIRRRPPEILVTNITMLEYLLLRAQDRPILEASQGALRWIVLDEAHSYVGSQAAEMALLLRRVRAGFGVMPENARLMATSATIGGEADSTGKLRAYAAALAGQTEDRIAVVEGRERPLPQFPAGMDVPLDASVLAAMPAEVAGALLAAHPRVQSLRKTLAIKGLGIDEVAGHLLEDRTRMDDAARLLDQAGRARWQGKPILAWRTHLFHRAQGGLWACPDANCSHRVPELTAEDAGWPFGAVWLMARARCDCGAPVYEVVACDDCGTVHLQGIWAGGAQPKITPPDPGEGDDFALDAEPGDDDTLSTVQGMAWLAPGAGIWVDDEGRVWDNAPPEDCRARRLRLFEHAEERGCCAGAEKARLSALRFGPAFFMGNALAGVLEDLVPPIEKAGLPAGGRRALSFSDSRQGVARLAAKLQQEAERTLTRAYLWHRVQEGPQADPERVEKLRAQLAQLRTAGLDDMAEDKEREILALTGAAAAPVLWPDLVQGLAAHTDLSQFAAEIWRQRRVGRKLAEDPARLAEAFLLRELFRRPRVQNNPETMGLLRLTFPDLEKRALSQTVPAPLAQAQIDNTGWLGLALTAIDRVFRQTLSVEMDQDMVPLVAPRSGVLNTVVATNTRFEDMERNANRWPNPGSTRHRLVQTVYTLIGGGPDSAVDQDRADEVLDALWQLITSTAARDVGKGGYRLDYTRWAAVVRLDHGWLCPVTRRIHGHSLNGRSPNDPARMMTEVELPRLPLANGGGLTHDQRDEVTGWTNEDTGIKRLRDLGVWTALHDRLATFPPYIRAQEHSAQIGREVLRRYEEAFGEGKINLLNCSTTMEMGVDIADVRLVVNSNVPPALSNYRQRAGRAGRRGEPWAFTLTFCRDLPLDQRVFTDPAVFLTKPIMAPKVWLDSASLVQRHVNAALLTVWLGERGGKNVLSGIGAFLGAGKTLAEATLPDNEADTFLNDLSSGWGENLAEQLGALVAGTALAGQAVRMLTVRCHDTLEKLVNDWRREYRTLLEGAEGTPDRDAQKAMEFRACRLAGEFLLGELARRGFTPAYGFPTDVVSFDNLAHRPPDQDETEARPSHFRSGAASRPLDQAIREYGPGAEIVIDGLVHLCEGVMPAWGAGADASRLEDLRNFWSCGHCHAFGLETTEPAACPQCNQPLSSSRKVLRPTGFLGGTKPHVGYESLAFSALDPVQISAQRGDWLALPEGMGRMRTDSAGQVATSAAGKEGGGFAVCLDCGRAEPMVRPAHGMPVPLSKSMARHYPLLRSRGMKLTHDGRCPATSQLSRIQRHVHLAQVKRTDVWEWQLPDGTTSEAATALAAALREALSERLGVEAAEIIPVVGISTGPAEEERLSLFLHDRAAGGAGLVARMAEPEMLAACLGRAQELLACPEVCRRGCPACILRPDLNQRDLRIDRPAGLDLVVELARRFVLDEALHVLGLQTRLAGQPAARILATRIRGGQVETVDIWLHGNPAEWDLPGWNLRRILAQAVAAGLRPRLHVLADALTAPGFDLDCKLALHSLAQGCDLHRAHAMPLADGLPVILRLGGEGTAQALVVADVGEAVPGSGWGAGAAAPLLVGPAPEIEQGPRLSAERLIELGTGNARLLEARTEFDGPASEFGKRFWKWIASGALLEITAMQRVGVVRLTYSDRYLLQAYTLGLLHSVLRAAPGCNGARIEIRSARADRPPFDPRRLFDSFPGDTIRQQVLQALLPAASVTLGDKQLLPHYRLLTAELQDGRQIRINLDQGFGWWQVAGAPVHDFAATAATQARLLAQGAFSVRGNADFPAPVTITMRKAPNT